MKQYKVLASATIYYEATVEANSEDEAMEMAEMMDGSEFVENDYLSSGWNIESVTQIEE